MLQKMNQHVPHNVIMLLQEARRRVEKRHAKRIANRKSASTSRARKKALVKDMTELNARLKRQAMILALLPDLVIVIDLQGNVTFCSAQVERVLQHNVSDLIGASLNEILVPSSRDRLQILMKELTSQNTPKEKAVIHSKNDTLSKDVNPEQPIGSNANVISASSTGKAGSVFTAPVQEKIESPVSGTHAKLATLAGEEDSSRTSFPLKVVQVNTARISTSDDNENSDGSASSGNANSKQPSSLTVSSVGNSGSDGENAAKAVTASSKAGESDTNKKDSRNLPSSDLSNSSADATNLQNANANLERNVRWHNKKLKDKEVAAQLRAGYMDDVIGAAVTANNASARLSSLQHHAESVQDFGCTSDEGEDESGYRESNDSREVDTSSSEWETKSDSKGKKYNMKYNCKKLFNLISSNTTVYILICGNYRSSKASRTCLQYLFDTQ